MILEFSRQIFEKSSNMKFHENSSSGSGVVPCGRTDRHDEANSCFSQFCERSKNSLRDFVQKLRIHCKSVQQKSHTLPRVSKQLARAVLTYFLMWMRFSIRDLHITLFIVVSFVKTGFRKGRTFPAVVNEVTFSRVPRK